MTFKNKTKQATGQQQAAGPDKKEIIKKELSTPEFIFGYANELIRPFEITL